MVSAREVRELLDDRPDLEPALEAVLAAEAPWTFDDVGVDSGVFGELVSRDVVVEADDGYRVADAKAVRRALDGNFDAADSRASGLDIELPSFDVDRLEVAAVVGALVLVFGLRLTSFPTVFQGDAVVLSSNDPYYYRYWLEQLLSNPETTLSTLPGGVTKGEPLMLAALWLATVTLGGTVGTAGTVLAWYPVVSALFSAVLVYAIAVVVTDDRRIGIASVAMLAVLPGHAFRTSVGFADHHAFDYPWLALTVLGVVLIASWARSAEASTLGVVTGIASIGVGAGAQTLAWEAGPLLVVPLGVAIAAMAVTAVNRNESVLPTVGPIVAGVGLAAAFAWFGHSTYGWHTTLVASAPLMLAVSGIGVLAVGEVWYRLGLPSAGLVAVELVGVVIGAGAFRSLRPEMWSRLTSSVTERLLARRNIAEVQSLFSESAGWLLLFGFLLLLALAYVVWASYRLLEDDRWTPVVVYAWYFLVLAAVQVRFAGQLSLLVAVFAGVGFVHLAAWIDVARVPAPLSGTAVDSLTLPDRRQVLTLVGLFVLVTGLSVVQIPVKTSQTTSPNQGYDAAAWIAEYSDAHDMAYPENYVLSEWGENRMYNYFVSGESSSYSYARSNYADFVTSTNASTWSERLQGRVGFVVTTTDVVTNASTLGTRLHRHNGSRTELTDGLAHFRLLHVEDEGAYKLFTPVRGAEISGEAEPNSSVMVRTTIGLDSYSFDYVRETTTDVNGSYSVRVPYPGTYRVAEKSVRVPEAAVRNGTTVRPDHGNVTTTTLADGSSQSNWLPNDFDARWHTDDSVTSASYAHQTALLSGVLGDVVFSRT
jgi:dolichyl-diphosphooligosaccharide--protein glycosyltransferase